MSKSGERDKVRHYNAHTLWRNGLFALIIVSCLVMANRVYAKKHRPLDASASASAASTPEKNETSATSTGEFSHYSFTLEELGVGMPIDLLGSDARREFPFSFRNDQVVTSATLKLDYAWSPALIPEESHLKVLLNDELMASLPLNKEDYNGLTSEIHLDPSLFIEFNRISFGAVMHYTRDCEDPLHSSLWAKVSNKSRLEVTVRNLKLPDDLGLLPAPFFDKLDHRKLNLPFVFSGKPGNDVLRVAGVVASWFGGLANYRGADFPVLVDTFPKGNGVIFVQGTMPEALGLAGINGPGLAVVTNPNNEYAKLLVVMGRDTKELELAAQALTVGETALSGRVATVEQLEIPERKPYDAPNWIPTDRPIQFGELTSPPALQTEQLAQANFKTSLAPETIQVNFSVPPDMFTWRSSGIPVDLHYRYTQHPVEDKSTLNVNINGIFLQSYPLLSRSDRWSDAKRYLMLEDGRIAAHHKFTIPQQNVFGKNQLQLNYFFDYTQKELCKGVFLNNERGAIDPESTLDFSAFPHYTALPNLRFFANDGFPYTRLADLSETAVVLPDSLSAADMEMYLLLMGRMGKVTGYPALRHQVITAAGVDDMADKDFIVMGAAGNQPLLSRWADATYLALENGTHRLKIPGPFERLWAGWNELELEDNLEQASSLITKGDGKLGALIGFESPLKSGRSVVLFTGDSTDEQVALLQAMTDDKTIEKFKGDMVLQSGKRIEGFQLTPSYYVGSLPFWMSLRWHLSKQPLILFIFIGFAALLVAGVSYRVLRAMAAERLKQ